MTRNVRVKPGSLTVIQARIGAVVAALFLLFGVTFAAVVLGEMDDAENGLRILIIMFFGIWLLACGGMLVFFARLSSVRPGDSLVELDVSSASQDAGGK